MSSENKYQVDVEMSFDFTRKEKKTLLAISNSRDTALCYAQVGDLEGIKFLEEIGYILDYSLMDVAASHNQFEIVKWLMKERNFYAAVTVMIQAIQCNHLEVFKVVRDNCDNNFDRLMLKVAIDCNQPEIAEWLTQNGLE